VTDVLWRELNIDGRFLGFEIKTDHCHYFFGSAHLGREDLSRVFSRYRFSFLKQVHGDNLVEADGAIHSADGHWTREKNHALVVQTADCMPVLIGCRDLAIGVHAGWRGVRAGILVKAARFMNSARSHIDRILIGPHISGPDFEVGADVAGQLDGAHRQARPSRSAILPHSQEGKAFVDLGLIARDQLSFGLGAPVHPEISNESTLRSPRFHSFRRGKDRGARQYSFVVLL
jgi:polyphenol oxidase